MKHCKANYAKLTYKTKKKEKKNKTLWTHGKNQETKWKNANEKAKKIYLKSSN